MHRRVPAGQRTARGGLFGGKATPEQIAAASPTSYIAKGFAPTIFIHGTNDGTVPAQSSIDFHTKLHALGVPSALTLIQGADHAFDNAAFDAIEVMAQSIDLFLDRLIVSPKPYPSFGGGGRGRGGRGRGGDAPGGRGQ
jgi:dipeptidyl aminopeptidase/acylaminoacyl peptidase